MVKAHMPAPGADSMVMVRPSCACLDGSLACLAPSRAAAGRMPACLPGQQRRARQPSRPEPPAGGGAACQGASHGQRLKRLLPWPQVCGPPPMMNSISGDKAPDKSQGPLSGMLKELGYDESNVYKF
jgi:hypothetical protein